MTQAIKKHRRKLSIIGALLLISTCMLVAFTNKPFVGDQHVRTLQLTAKDNAFYTADTGGVRNPTIELDKGETVRLVLINEERGRILHCMTIVGLGVKTEQSIAPGERETLFFTPSNEGTYVYSCLMHKGMAGMLIVK